MPDRLKICSAALSGRRADDRLDRRLGRSWWRDPRQAHAFRGTVRPFLATVGESDARALVMTQLAHKRRQVLARGTVIPAHPLALTADRRLDERRQRALTRYYIAPGAGGLAVGVHTTQFAIPEPRIGLFAPVLELAAAEMDRADPTTPEPLPRTGGICVESARALREAQLLADCDTTPAC